MQRDPSLHQLVLLAWKLTFKQISVRNLEDRLGFCILNMNVRKMMLFCIKHIHSYEYAVEHADGWQSRLPRMKRPSSIIVLPR